ncbi:hypothetical protein BDQ17DRAFT_1385191, partial [Cyathus striatus]
PPEIEDEIFRHVVTTRPYYDTDAHLAGVSKRVQLCVEPVLYRTIKLYGDSAKYGYNIHEIYRLIHEDKFKIALKFKPKSFFQENVKNVLFIASVSKEFATSLLSICTGIQHLFVWLEWHDESFVQNIAPLPLHSLEVDASVLGALAISQVKLSQVRYISLGGLCFDEDIDYILMDSFQWLPALTHLVIPVGEQNEYLARTLRTLRNIKQLKSIFILLVDFYVWGNDDGVRELISQWEAMDSKIMVVRPQPESSIRRWEERMDCGGIDVQAGYRYGEDCWSNDSEEDMVRNKD